MNSDASSNEDIKREISGDDLVQRVGNLARMLRDSMRELGLNKEIEHAAEAIPDTRARLNYVANMTEKAAERSLNAVDRAQPLQDGLEKGANDLSEKWQAWFDSPLELEDARELVKQTRGYLGGVPEVTSKINKEYIEIMMAQDFQDLTGQVIMKLMDVIKEVEHQLMQVLLDSVPGEDDRKSMQERLDKSLKEEEEEASLLNGPQVDATAEGVVSSQDDVDDLLSELGF